MSDFTVLRSIGGYCLVLDKKRIAGGKPDYRGENVLVDWTTEVAYGPVDDLAAENAKLRELAERAWKTAERLCQAFDGPCSDDGVTIAKPCPMDGRDEECIYGQLQKELLELGIEVG